MSAAKKTAKPKKAAKKSASAAKKSAPAKKVAAKKRKGRRDIWNDANRIPMDRAFLGFSHLWLHVDKLHERLAWDAFRGNKWEPQRVLDDLIDMARDLQSHPCWDKPSLTPSEHEDLSCAMAEVLAYAFVLTDAVNACDRPPEPETSNDPNTDPNLH